MTFLASEKFFYFICRLHQCFIERYEYDKLIEMMNNEMKKVGILAASKEKNYYMVFHRAGVKTQSNEISNVDNIISSVFSKKNVLVIIIDNQLKWLEHMQYILKKSVINQ